MNALGIQNRIVLFICVGLLVAGGFYVGVAVGSEQSEVDRVSALSNKEEGKPGEVDFSSFWKVWNMLEDKHISGKDVSAEERVWSAIQGLTSAYDDPNTVFMPPQESERFESDISGQFEGVGMEVGKRDDVLTVVSPLRGTPAEAAGLQAEDRIIEIDGESTQDMSVEEAVRLIRGEEGTDVVLTIVREGRDEPFEVSVTRGVIDIPTIETELRDDGVFVVELYNFTGQVVSLFEGAMEEFKDSGSDKLILDLRNNPGGFLQASVEIASYFLPAGEVVLQERFSGDREKEIYRSQGYDIFDTDIDMVILMNQGSASASEIVAGALRDHGIATTIGERTFGKGSVQELADVTSNTSLKVTIAEWLTPNGDSFEGEGLEPDIVVEMTRDDVESGRDPQFDRAIELLLGE